MDLIGLVVILLIVGVLLWAVENAPFVSESIRPIIRWVVIIVVLLWLISVFFGRFPLPRIGR
ncbi:MAG TPA: Thivi_2564 family membrane protein, partial [Nitrospiraceae bacterium]